MPEMLTLQSIPSYAKPGVACDNESTYAGPATSDGWYRIHDTIRMEMVKFEACLKAASAPLQAWQVASLQAYWAGHEQLVHSHHEHEDKLFTPMLKERIDFPEKLEADHDALLELMADVAAAVKALKAGGDVSDAIAKFEAYKVAMEPHLVEEQNVLVPLMRAYFPFVEVNKRVGEIMKKMDPVLMGAFVHSFGAVDFAGGLVVHVSSGVAGLVASLMLGKRIGYPRVPKAPHSLVLTHVGGAMLWVGWFGFNAGSATAADFVAGRAMLVTQIASASGAVAWSVVERYSYGLSLIHI